MSCSVSQSARADVPRIAVVMADASNYASHSLEKQAKAIHKDGVTIVGVGEAFVPFCAGGSRARSVRLSSEVQGIFNE